MGQITYGPGALFFTRTDIAVTTPINVGYVNEFSYEETGETKSLYGQTDYPLAVRRGTVKTAGKMKAALMSATALNVFNGNTITKGTQTLAALGETASIPGSTSFTVTAANAATFSKDLGPVYASNLVPFSNMGTAALTGAGQYSVNAATGVYTFDSVDAGVAVLLNYAYTNTVSGGYSKTTIARQIGQMPTFQLDYVTTDPQGGTFYFRAYACVAAKLTKGFKLTDFMMPELDFELAQNAAGQVYMESYSPTGF